MKIPGYFVQLREYVLKYAELATISFTLMRDISLNSDQPVQVEPDAKQTSL